MQKRKRDVENSLESDSSSGFAGLICYFCDIFAFLVFQSCKMAGKSLRSLWLSVFLQCKFRLQFREILLQTNEFTVLLYCFVFVFLLLIDTSCLSLVS